MRWTLAVASLVMGAFATPAPLGVVLPAAPKRFQAAFTDTLWVVQMHTVFACGPGVSGCPATMPTPTASGSASDCDDATPSLSSTLGPLVTMMGVGSGTAMSLVPMMTAFSGSATSLVPVPTSLVSTPLAAISPASTPLASTPLASTPLVSTSPVSTPLVSIGSSSLQATSVSSST
ncbi:hypothetical protein BAUCODRAFT_172717 [Baudoinia panamericana UAMH 10762]|uniref:Uncharacterized protein n=1 Tax=Baudoinia panamericana (strain UAMH 10762) TaxID=717646 RepID=M2NMW2_BAUPA|nr:uncharacterized protein BAUCODRAFT_172717 [Baudoinia panamericana UAMH 10762]EMD00536.1 hypothetical protein BAUCODRAFT_172717 [Baudoinia panamericana UAMH 10762]